MVESQASHISMPPLPIEVEPASFLASQERMAPAGEEGED
jgi:hypothetical protein